MNAGIRKEPYYCLDFLNKPLNSKDIKEELLVGGVNDLSKIDEYANVVLKTRKELTTFIKNFGNADIKKRVGLIK